MLDEDSDIAEASGLEHASDRRAGYELERDAELVAAGLGAS